MSGPGPSTPHRWGAARTVAAIATRWSILALVAALAAAGALLGPVAALGWSLACALVAGVLAAALGRGPATGSPRVPHPAVVAVYGGCVPVVLTGSAALGPAGGLATGVLVALLAGVAGSRLVVEAPGGPPPAREGEPQDEDALRRMVHGMPTDLLLAEWRGTSVPLTDLDDELRRIRMRDLLIGEFRGRDPAGTARWMAGGAAGSPEQYIGRDPARGG